MTFHLLLVELTVLVHLVDCQRFSSNFNPTFNFTCLPNHIIGEISYIYGKEQQKWTYNFGCHSVRSTVNCTRRDFLDCPDGQVLSGVERHRNTTRSLCCYVKNSMFQMCNERILKIFNVHLMDGEAIQSIWRATVNKSVEFRVKVCSDARSQANTNKSNVCKQGWFGGRCQYKCHCQSKCDKDGLCVGDVPRCHSSWFGTKCQYQDLATINGVKITTNVKQNIQWLTDRDHQTCNTDPNSHSVTIVWNAEYWFTWMRIVLKQS
ncbi:multiple epidermal growth factor-like domains protein 6, partial [Biomphalaria pfeifferi]